MVSRNCWRLDWSRWVLPVVSLLAGLMLVMGCKKEVEEIDFTLKESNPVGVHHADRAFDRSISPDNFWESSGFPLWLEINYKEGKEIKEYTLQSGETGERMPKEWKFQGSNDGISWKNLDIQSNQVGWKQDEGKTYKVAIPSLYKSYRFDFTAGNEPTILRIYEIKLME